MTGQRLVSMANQIAMNAPDRDRAAELTAAHLRAFWTPAMIADLAEQADEGEISAGVLGALAILTPESNPPRRPEPA